MQTVAVDLAVPRPYHWSRQEVERLAELGAFEGVRVELIEGQIVEMSPKGPPHVVQVIRVRKVLEQMFPTGKFTVRSEAPLALSDHSAPEPDLVVAIGDDMDYATAHPTPSQIVLVVEVADTSLRFDVGAKADLYAAAGIVDYWVVNAAAGVVVVLRSPQTNAASPTGHRYAERRDYRPGEQIVTLADGARPTLVAALLP